MKKRTTQISLDFHEAVKIRTRRVLIADCIRCHKKIRMVAANEAAMIAGLSAREIYRLVEGGQLHFIEDQNGLLYVCIESLDQLLMTRTDVRKRQTLELLS